MSVMLFGSDELGNVAAYLSPGSSSYAKGRRHELARQLAVVSVANVEEFIDTYSDRHGTPEPQTAEEIRKWTPHLADPKRALVTLKLLAYNAHGDKAKRPETLEALVSILTSAVQV